MDEINNVKHQDRLRYLLFLHNINTFMIPTKDMNEQLFYSTLVENKHKNLTTVYSDGALKDSIVEYKARIDKKPYIFCAFHLGNYRLISRFLYEKNIKHTIILNILQKEEEDTFINTLKKINKSENICNYINIAHRYGILKVRSMIRENRSILIFTDANLSTKEATNSTKEKIQFLNKEIEVMTGVAYLSKKFSLPIMPVITFNEENNYIVFSKELDKTISTNMIMQELWSFLEKHILKFPFQWEGWLFADKLGAKTIFPKRQKTSKNGLKFNNKEYYFINYPNNKYQIYSIYTNSLLHIKEETYTLLKKINDQKIVINKSVLVELFGQKFYNETIENRIFI